LIAENTEKILDSYSLDVNGLKADIKIVESQEFSPLYNITIMGIGGATKLLLNSLRAEILSMVPINTNLLDDKKYLEQMTKKYVDAANLLVDKYLPGTNLETKKVLTAYVINIMLGLGDLEVPIADPALEEITVNGSKKRIWVFHEKYGWCETNIEIDEENEIYNYSEQIGRKVGRQITNLFPIMDAELPDGSRINSTLFPISQSGNTITIRKFRKNPWTITSMIDNGTVSAEIAATIWLCIQNEISLLISGGTASGKTSFLNAISLFIPADRRVISIEETRELTLPSFLQWVPMLTRQPNPEGKGSVSLYDLMINALRQRPDVVIVGEIRTEKDAETLFEAIHTGHAVYGTVHADDVEDTVIRMTNPPIAIPKIMLNSIGGIATLLRHRRYGMRKVYEFGEMLNTGDARVVYKWYLKGDKFEKINEFTRLLETIILYGGYTKQEIDEDIMEKAKVLAWLVKNKIFNVDPVGYVIANYYKDKNSVMEVVDKDMPYAESYLRI
jgi:flagellar protein FlaI